MASPQTKNGYTRIANELLTEISRYPFSANGLRIVLWVVRESYGWNKKFVEPTPFRSVSEAIKMPIGSVHLAMQVLIEKRVILRDDKDRLYLNKDYESWTTVQPTERKTAFSPLNESVQPTERKRSAHRTETIIKKGKTVKKGKKGKMRSGPHLSAPRLKK